MKDKFSWEKFRSEKFAILCENKIVQEMFIEEALKQGFKIYTNEDTLWDKYKENTCYTCVKYKGEYYLSLNNKSYCKSFYCLIYNYSNKVKIYRLKQAINMPNKEFEIFSSDSMDIAIKVKFNKYGYLYISNEWFGVPLDKVSFTPSTNKWKKANIDFNKLNNYSFLLKE